jgi:hypothetical protein
MAEEKCTGAVRAGRVKKAREFRLAAELLEESASGRDDLADAYVTCACMAASQPLT